MEMGVEEELEVAEQPTEESPPLNAKQQREKERNEYYWELRLKPYH